MPEIRNCKNRFCFQTFLVGGRENGKLNKKFCSQKCAKVFAASEREKLPFSELGYDTQRKIVISEQKNSCSHCKKTRWRGQPINLEVDHKDGNTSNNSRSNLEALCPNCHSYTLTWRGKNKKSFTLVSDEALLEAISKTENNHQALKMVGLAPKGKNYERANRVRLQKP